MIPTHFHDEIRPDGLDLSGAEAALGRDEALGGAPARPQRGEGAEHGGAAGAHHALGGGAVTEEGRVADEVVDELGAAAAEAEVGEAVLVGDGVVRDAAEAEDEGDEDAGAVLAGGAVHQDRVWPPLLLLGGGGRGGEMAQDGGEGSGARGAGARLEDVGVDLDEALEGGKGSLD